MRLKYEALYEVDSFLECIDEALGAGNFSWKFDLPMQRRLGRRKNRDHAAHLAYRKNDGRTRARTHDVLHISSERACSAYTARLAQRFVDVWGNDSKRGWASGGGYWLLLLEFRYSNLRDGWRLL